jgi:hypothetical protein
VATSHFLQSGVATHDGGKILAHLFYFYTSSITILLTQKNNLKKGNGF